MRILDKTENRVVKSKLRANVIAQVIIAFGCYEDCKKECGLSHTLEVWQEPRKGVRENIKTLKLCEIEIIN